MTKDLRVVIASTGPPKWRKKVLYQGEPLELKDIPEKTGIDEKEAREYWWNISWKEHLEKGKTRIAKGIYTYNELIENKRSLEIKSYQEIIFSKSETEGLDMR